MSDEPTPASDESGEPLVPETSAGEPVDEVDSDTLTFNVMSIESVLFDLSDSSPLVHLIEEETPYRYIAMPIALPEAVALHNALDKIDGRRPGTHEVIAEILRRLQADVIAARLVRYAVSYTHLTLPTIY